MVSLIMIDDRHKQMFSIDSLYQTGTGCMTKMQSNMHASKKVKCNRLEIFIPFIPFPPADP